MRSSHLGLKFGDPPSSRGQGENSIPNNLSTAGASSVLQCSAAERVHRGKGGSPKFSKTRPTNRIPPPVIAPRVPVSHIRGHTMWVEVPYSYRESASLVESRLSWTLAGTYRPGPRSWVSVTTHLGQVMQGSTKHKHQARLCLRTDGPAQVSGLEV
jgi:hypothetical protein